MRYGELFAGVGGLSLGLHRAGMQCAFHAEIADFPRRILKARFPDVPLYGDVATLTGEQLVRECGAINLLAGGSPCQGLSVAGRGAGLADDRSILFFQQVRLWKETNAPMCLWENVPGALSSNKGADFAVILSTFAGAPVTCPTKSGRWPRSGYVSGPNGVAAWRVLDAQYFGVPQRRRRVFVIAARADGADPGKILFELESLRRHPAPSGKAGEGIAADAQDGAGSASVHDARGHGNGDLAPTLAEDHQNRVTDYTAIVATWDPAQVTNPHNRSTVQLGQPCQSLVESPPAILTFKPSHYTRGKDSELGDVMPPLTADADKGDQENVIVAFNETGHESWQQQKVAGSLNAHESKEAYALVAQMINISDGAAKLEDVSGTIFAKSGQTSGIGAQTQAVLQGVPRRLMPVECERLMSWPDNWTLVEGARDTPRYKACGNGVVSNVVQWIGERIIAEVGA